MYYHHEMQYAHQSIQTIAFLCLDLSAGVDGSTYFSDNIRVTRDLENLPVGRKLKERGVCVSRRWEKSDRCQANYVFGLTDNRKVALERAQQQ